MKKRFFFLALALVWLLPAGCAPAGQGSQSREEARLTLVASTYPVYLFAAAVAQGVEGVVVERLDTGGTSCLHDYTLSVNDMKKLEGAHVIALNGVGLEDFMADALAAADAAVIDCSEGVELLESLSHRHGEGDHSRDGHDHGHWDPHIWLDPENAAVMVENIRDGLIQADPDQGELYRSNAQDAQALLYHWDGAVGDVLEMGREFGLDASELGLITFHDGFQYFAHAYGLPLLESIEEEPGSEASAQEIVEIAKLVTKQSIPVIFTEVSGSDATAQAIARETGCRVARLSMLMDGPDGALSNYLDVLLGNMAAVVNGFAGKEVVGLG